MNEVVEVPQEDRWKLYDRLVRFAWGLSRDKDVARDLAMWVLDNTEGKHWWHYTSVAVKNKFLQIRCTKKRWNLDHIASLDDDFEDIARNKSSMDAGQETAMLAREMCEAVSNLPESCRQVMVYVALEYTPDEIAAVMDIPKKDVYWKTGMARDILRKRTEYELIKRGHSRYIGIRRDHHRWSASIRRDGKYHHLGYHATAEDAARAYDAAAVRLDGSNATLNFPVLG